MKAKVSTLTVVFLAGCASTGVVPTSGGAYMIAKQSAAGVFGTPDAVKAEIYTEANQFCARSSKAVETVTSETKGAIPFVRTGSASLEFRCIDRQAPR